MTLDQFLNLPQSPTAEEFGKKCEPPISGASVSRIRRGEQNITRETMIAIINASGGMVSAEGLVKAA